MTRRFVVEESCEHGQWKFHMNQGGDIQGIDCSGGSRTVLEEGIPDVDARLLGSALEYWEGFEFGDPLGDIGALPIILRSARWVAAVFGETR